MREVIKDSCIRNELLEIFYGLTRKGADRPLHGTTTMLCIECKKAEEDGRRYNEGSEDGCSRYL